MKDFIWKSLTKKIESPQHEPVASSKNNVDPMGKTKITFLKVIEDLWPKYFTNKVLKLWKGVQ